jgi:dCTP deaminase
MGILVDHELARLLERGHIVEGDYGAINPASIDLHVGYGLFEEKRPPLHLELLWRFFPNFANQIDGSTEQERWRFVDLGEYTRERPYWLYQNHLILIDSIEGFNIPVNLCANFQLKSSAGRMGYEHALAGFCDPGWNGSKLTKELTSLRRWRPLPIYPGMRLGQLIFHKLSSVPDADYSQTGRYNGDGTVAVSRGL